ncbi:MAG TPA: hypothetical protein VGB95_00545 [Chitinophagales bacterium]
MKTKKMLIAVAVLTALTFALSSCDKHTCPTYSQAETTQTENNG